ncbi:DNA-binding protein [Ligilactobacillus murinus]|nr:DNA-binding protein [Ligilactobacillus murinus]
MEQTEKQRRPTQDEQRILNLLGYGADNAKTTRHLRLVAGLSERRVRQIIGRLIIVYGVPIAGVRSGQNRGYYIVTDDDERTGALGPIKAEINELGKRKQALEQAELKDNWQEHYSKGDGDSGKLNF